MLKYLVFSDSKIPGITENTFVISSKGSNPPKIFCIWRQPIYNRFWIYGLNTNHQISKSTVRAVLQFIPGYIGNIFPVHFQRIIQINARNNFV